MKKVLAIWIGKFALFWTRALRVGSGSSLPGLLAEKVDKDILKKLTKKLKYGAIIITGTNGKTTTAKMLSEILADEGFAVLHNPTGSNLTRGIASALIFATNLFGTRIHSDIAVFEVDEATMPEATSKIRPKFVLVTNLFRDQLDRYGELDKTATIIGNSLQGFSNTTTILNADDPLVANLAKYASGPVKYFGIEDPNISTKSTAAMDSKDCLECGHEFKYSSRYFGHLGVWECSNCSAKRPKPQYIAQNVKMTPETSNFELKLSTEKLNAQMQISGLYNVYNAAAAAAAAEIAGGGGPAISQALRDFSAAFGRMEKLEIEGQNTMLLLVKNPTGANQAVSSALSDAKPKNLLFALNDNFADGTDISWIWDIDFEAENLKPHNFAVSGIRAEDMALRLKYAGLDPKKISMEKDLKKAVLELAKITAKGETCYVFPTYTAMVEIRNIFSPKEDELSELGKVTKRGM